MKELLRLGYIEIVPRNRANGSQSTNRYRLIHDADLAVLHDHANVSTSGSQGCQPEVGGVSTSEVYRVSTSAVYPRTSNRTSHRKDTCDGTIANINDEHFERFWRTYPSRHPHGNPKKPARQKFDLALKKGNAAADIIRGAQNYAAHVEDEDGDRRFVPMAQTWISQERWIDYQEKPEREQTVPHL